MPAPVALNTPAAGPALDVVLNALITTAEKQGTHASFIAVDSGCARDVESDDGLAGFFGERRPTGMRLKTGSGERCPAAFEGSHRHFIITADLHVIEEVRHNVICAAGTRFKRSLYAPRTATSRDIETTLGRCSRLTFCSDGRVVPLRDTGQGYYLVRFFERSHAERAVSFARHMQRMGQADSYWSPYEDLMLTVPDAVKGGTSAFATQPQHVASTEPGAVPEPTEVDCLLTEVVPSSSATDMHSVTTRALHSDSVGHATANDSVPAWHGNPAPGTGGCWHKYRGCAGRSRRRRGHLYWSRFSQGSPATSHTHRDWDQG